MLKEISHLQSRIKTLPETPGVYLMYADDSECHPLYIGKSNSIKKRIYSHCQEAKKKPSKLRLLSRTNTIEYFDTAGDLGALLLESKLIKALKPLYNKRLRRCRSVFHYEISESSRTYLTLKKSTIDNFTAAENCYGLFETQKAANSCLRDLCKTNQLCFKRCGLEKGTGPCFQFHLKKCLGCCCEKEPYDSHDERLKEALRHLQQVAWPFTGAIKIVEKNNINKSEDIHIFNQWRHLRSVYACNATNNISPLQNHSKIEFDRDQYHILRGILTRDYPDNITVSSI